MNTRDYKSFGEGAWHHVYTRGNGKMNVFRDGQDYAVFLQRLCATLGQSKAPFDSGRVRITPLEQGAFSIAAYCLMPNHMHFLIQQNTEIPISKLFLKLLTSYSKYFNGKYEHVGHVFQDRFKAVHITGNTQLLHVSAYIHQNPKVAGLVRKPDHWKYSSYPEYLTPADGGVCDTTMILEQFKNSREYVRFVEESFEDIRARKDVRQLMMDETL